MRKSFWQKIEEAKKKGITEDQFERIENLEAAIACHENKIEEYEREIKQIEKAAMLEKVGGRDIGGGKAPSSPPSAFVGLEELDF